MLPTFCLIVSSIIAGTLGVPISGDPGVVTSETFNQSLILDTVGNYLLFWNYNETDITFEVHVRTKGWVGFGLSGQGNMFPGDVIVGWVTPDGHAHFSDRHTVGHVIPIKDKSQDWHLLLAKENDFGTVLRFTRKIVTCDTVEDKTIQEGTVRLIYAYSQVDPASEDAIIYHGTTRGTKSVSLLNTNRAPADMTKDVIYYDFLNNNYHVPSAETTYLCRGFQMPDIGKHHMIKYEAKITPGNEDHVHHSVLYRCPGNASNDGMEGMCYQNRPKNVPQCASILLVWAVGGEAFYFPDNVGISIGGPNDVTFFVLETHYDNPTGRADIIDNSGIRITLTKTLRQQEAGILDVGLDVSTSHVVPPYQKEFISKGFCSENCVRKSFNQSQLSEVKMFAGFQHSHLIGAAIKTKHFRQGTELKPLLEDPNYDFNFQQSWVLPQEVPVYPGDSFSVECSYDSTSRQGPTFGGLSTRNEMCLTILYYYPKMAMDICNSNPLYDTYQAQGFDFGLYQKFVKMDWTNQTNVDDFVVKTAASTVRHNCFGTNMYLNEDFVEHETSHPYIPPSTPGCT